MSKVTVHNPEQMNEFEMLLVQDYMEKQHPKVYYNMTPGNGCIWVYWGSSIPMNLYFIFRDGKIVDIQID